MNELERNMKEKREKERDNYQKKEYKQGKQKERKKERKKEIKKEKRNRMIEGGANSFLSLQSNKCVMKSVTRQKLLL